MTSAWSSSLTHGLLTHDNVVQGDLGVMRDDGSDLDDDLEDGSGEDGLDALDDDDEEAAGSEREGHTSPGDLDDDF